MKRVVPLLHFFAMVTLLLANPSSAQRKIIGGQESVRGRWPWMAGIAANDRLLFEGLFCGGVMIAPTWMLTAAHCLTDPYGDEASPQGLAIVAGIHDLHEQPQYQGLVKNIYRHPEWNPENKRHDIALLELRSSYRGPLATLADAATNAGPGVSATVIGWGKTAEGERYLPGQLRDVSVPIVSNQTCQKAYSSLIQIWDTQLCAGLSRDGQEGGSEGGPETKKDACQGDSGGPLVIPTGEQGLPVVVGVVGWGIGCGRPGLYGIYTRVSAYRDWISKTVGGSFPVSTFQFSTSPINGSSR